MPSWASADDCNLARIAALDINLDEGGDPYVPMTISGQKINLLIDTGGIFSMMTEQSAQLLDLKELPAFGSGEEMFGGKSIKKFVEARDINLGGLKAERMPMQIISDHFLATGIGGTLAPNILRHYDADFDFGHAKFNLFSQDHCQGKVVYWTDDPYAAIKVSIDDEGHIKVPIQLDGQDIQAAVDTGSWRSLLSLEPAKRLFSIPDNDPKLKFLKVDERGTWFSYRRVAGVVWRYWRSRLASSCFFPCLEESTHQDTD